MRGQGAGGTKDRGGWAVGGARWRWAFGIALLASSVTLAQQSSQQGTGGNAASQASGSGAASLGGALNQAPPNQTLFGAASPTAGWSWGMGLTGMDMYSAYTESGANSGYYDIENLGLQLDGARITDHGRFEFTYAPSYSAFQPNSGLNSLSQSYGQDLSYDVSARTSLQWNLTAARYSSATDFGLGALNSGNLGLAAAEVPGLELNSEIFFGSTGFDLTHQTALHSRLHFDLTASTYNYGATSGGVGSFPGYHDDAFAAQMGWDHDLSPERRIGVTAGDSYFIVDGAGQDYQMVTVDFRQLFAGDYALDLSGGPAYWETHGVVVDGVAIGPADALDYTAQAMLSRRTPTSQIWIQGGRGPQLGNAAVGLAMVTASLGYSEQWTSRWSTSVIGWYESISYPGTAAAASPTTDTYVGEGRIGCRFVAGVSGFLAYSYNRLGAGTGFGTGYTAKVAAAGLTFNVGSLADRSPR